MNGSLILEAVGYVDEALIEEAEREIPDAPRLGRRWLAGAVCAALCLVSAWAWQMNENHLPEEAAAEEERSIAEETVEQTGTSPWESAAEPQESVRQEQAEHTVLYSRGLTICIEEESEDGIVGVVTEVNGLSGLQTGDRVLVAVAQEEKTYVNHLFRVEPILSVTEREGQQYLEIRAFEMDLMEECITVLAEQEDGE